ncbi:class III poly(R)-hydroxyalkanoic acid synthase subunit PhaE [Luteimonas sp. RIT-PG2_3]
MLNSGFGGVGVPGTPEEFERLARQYWGAWGDAIRNAVPGMAPAPTPAQMGARAWQDGIDWWTRQFSGPPVVEDTLGRFNRQASSWYAQMQQVAAQFGGRDNTAADIVSAWKQALGNSAVNLFPDMLNSMAGNGLQGMDQWIRNVEPMLGALRGEGASLLQMPAFGFAREHQERLQALAQAQLDYQEANKGYNALMLRASQEAFEIFEKMLSEREGLGQQIQTPRALFDLWVDAAEQAYAAIALSPDFRSAYGELVNAQMRLRAGVQREIEQASAQLGMPTRTELDGAHRKIVELERALRKLRDQAEQGGAHAAPAGGQRAKPASPRARKGAAAASPAPEPVAADKATPAKRSAPEKATRKAASGTPDAGVSAASAPIAKQSVSGKLTQRAPAKQAKAVGQPSTATPSAGGKPAKGKSAKDKPANDKPAPAGAVAGKSIADKSAASKPATSKSAASKPGARRATPPPRRRSSPTNGFSSSIPVTPVPIAPEPLDRSE